MSVDLSTAELMPASSLFQSTGIDASHGDRQERRWKLVLAAMRGRYHWVLVLSVLLGTVGAVIGWRLGVPIYRSGVPIRVAPVLPRVLFQDEEKGLLPQFERFVETQIALIQGQHVIEAAVDHLSADDNWRSAHGDGHGIDDAILNFSKSISVLHNNELVMVYVSDPDPKSAMAGAQAVVDAFKAFSTGSTTDTDTNRLAALQQLQATQNQELQTNKQQLAKITDKYAAQNVGALYNAKFEEFRKLQSTIADLHLELTLAVAGASGPQDAPSIDELSLVDQVLASLILERDQVESRLTSLRAHGKLQEHQDVRDAQANLNGVELKITNRVKALLKLPRTLLVSGPKGSGSPDMGRDSHHIQAQVSEVEKMLDKTKQEMLDLYRDNLQVGVLRADIEGNQKQLDQSVQRMEELRIESRVGNRMTVLGDAERPLKAFADPRRKYATLGGVGGIACGFLLILALGLADPRMRHAEEVCVRLSVNHILGLLPNIPKDFSDPDQAALAAHAVHHIRAMLQIRTQGNGVPVFAVTSPVAGAGKTSLILGLGLSFASTGARTLLIDCDLVGAGLTIRLHTMLQRKIGRVLLDRGLVTHAQLETALTDGQGSETRFLERLAAMGCVEAARAGAAIHAKGQPANGLLEVLQGAPLERCVTESDVPGLWVLPLGGASPRHATGLSPAAISQLLQEAKTQFDTILVDTGPVPGSLEASVVSAQADGVVVIVSRGESARLAEACHAQLRAVGARTAGIVFNRALGNDVLFGSATKAASSAQSSSRSIPNEYVLDRFNDRADFGPVARAVASSSATVPIGSRPRQQATAASNGGRRA